jgi:hypothetical protein
VLATLVEDEGPVFEADHFLDVAHIDACDRYKTSIAIGICMI